MLTAMLIVFAIAAGVGLRPPPLPAVAASRFVPLDAERGFASFDEGSDQAPAMVENALLSPDQVATEVPAATWQAIEGAPDHSSEAAYWWRESLVVTGFTAPAQRYRIRSVGPDGVGLAGQEWGGNGIVMSPALRELSADVHAGDRWTSSGRALADPIADLLTYRNSSTAAAPPRPGRRRCRLPAGHLGDPAAPGFLRWRGRNRRRRPTDTRPHRRGATPISAPTSSPSGWKQGPLRLEAGDDTFGALTGQISTDARYLARDSTGAVRLSDPSGRDVQTLTPLQTHRLWLHVRLHWTAALPDLAVTSPLVLRNGRLLIATVTGDVLLLDSRTGEQIWRQRLSSSISQPPSTGSGVVVIGTVDGSATAL